MLKTIEEPVTVCESISDFVFKFDAQEEFKKEFGCSIEDWDNDCCDDECIEKILEKRPGLFRVVFVETRGDGYFNIEEYSNKGKPDTEKMDALALSIAERVGLKYELEIFNIIKSEFDEE